MENLFQDLRYGIRMLAKNPGFTLIAILALALGIGANTAIFSVINAVLLNPLPYKNPDQLNMIWHSYPSSNLERASLSVPSYIEYKTNAAVFEQVAVASQWSVNMTGSGEPERLQGGRVSANFTTTLGVEPLLGRTFFAEEEEAGKNRVVLLSYAFWNRAFGADPSVTDKTITLDGNQYNVVGVMPAGFKFFADVDLWSPITFTPQQMTPDNHGNEFLLGLARRKAGVSFEQAQAEMNGVAERLRQDFYTADWGISLVPLREQFVGDIRPGLLILAVAVGCVLLIACANVANLLLARAAWRQKEMAVRAALGASRVRVIRQLLTESVLLAFVGGACGLALAFGGVRLLIAGIPPDISQFIIGWSTIGIDGRVLLFTFAVAMLTGIGFGLIPALQSSKLDLNETLKESGKGAGSGGRSHRVLNAFVVAEIAIALFLLICSGLLIRSFTRLQTVDPGFNPQNSVVMQLTLSRTKYPERAQQAVFFEQILERVAPLPGVQHVGVGSNIPMSQNNNNASYAVEGLQVQQGEPSPHGDPRSVSPDYFRAMGIRLLQGRFFNEQDTKDSLPVAIIDDVLAAKYFANENPLGKRIAAFFDSNGDQLNWRQIVGVVAHVKQYGLDGKTKEQYYFPMAQRGQPNMYLIVRTETKSTDIVASVRQAIRSVDADQPIYRVQTLEQVIYNSMAQQRFSTYFLSVFAAVAMLLAAIGIYGVMSYSVSQRTHEIGIRMALGASRSRVMRLVVGRGLLLTAIGIAIGVGISFIITRWMASLLFGVTATDLLTFIGTPLLLSFVAILATCIPAFRATKVDPMHALRYE